MSSETLGGFEGAGTGARLTSQAGLALEASVGLGGLRLRTPSHRPR